MQHQCHASCLPGHTRYKPVGTHTSHRHKRADEGSVPKCVHAHARARAKEGRPCKIEFADNCPSEGGSPTGHAQCQSYRFGHAPGVAAPTRKRTTCSVSSAGFAGDGVNFRPGPMALYGARSSGRPPGAQGVLSPGPRRAPSTGRTQARKCCVCERWASAHAHGAHAGQAQAHAALLEALEQHRYLVSGCATPTPRPSTLPKSVQARLKKCSHAARRASRKHARKMLARLLPAGRPAGKHSTPARRTLTGAHWKRFPGAGL